MTHTYLDTCCLIRRAELSGPAPTVRTQHAGPPVVALLRQATASIATSQIGLAEFHDVVTTMWRNVNPPDDVYNETWCDNAIAETLRDVEARRLGILPLPPKVFEKAMTLVTMSTRQHGRKFRVWDAIHLITAVAWSVDQQTKVELWTTDGDFDGFVGVYPYFANHVKIVHLDKI